MTYHEIPKGGAKSYIKALNLEKLCTTNMWKCSFETLQEVARQRGWDVLRKQYWEEKLLSILISNAVESESPIEAERALKALRSKAVLRGYDLTKIHEKSIETKTHDHDYEKDIMRLQAVGH